jgi:hypothetical protein
MAEAAIMALCNIIADPNDDLLPLFNQANDFDAEISFD